MQTPDTVTPSMPKKNHTKALIIISISIIMVTAAIIAGIPYINRSLTILSLKKIDEYPLYSMTYYGGYNLDYEVDNPNIQSAGAVQCSCFMAKNEKGEPLFCRNLDYTLTNHPIVMMTTHAPGKNATLSMTDLFYLGYGGSKQPTGSLFDDRALLNAPRICVDGMNNYGVAVAILSVPHAQPTVDPKKKTIDEVAANRLLLDNARNLDEAIEVIKQYNILFHQGSAHFMIADANGNSAVVEFVNGTVVTVKNDKPWQVVTNFILSSAAREGDGQGRYDIAENELEQKDGRVTQDEAMGILRKITQPGTLWSVVYNLKTGEVKLTMNQKFDNMLHFKLDMHH